MTQSGPKDFSHLTIDDISIAGQMRLLEMAYSRLRFGLIAMPVITIIFCFYYRQYSNDYNVLIWSALDWLLFLASLGFHHYYKLDRETLSDEAMLKRWLPRIHALVIVHGLIIASLLPIVRNITPVEFKLVYATTIMAMVAGNATHQSPVISVFHRFLATSWHLTVLLMPWTMGQDWVFITLLAVLYSIGMYYYSLASHRFFLQLIWLEEEGARLAERYKAAKEEAEAALKAKNQFLTTASHDLRQPVHAMGFLVESISRKNRDSSLNQALNDLKQSLRSVTQMFNSLLDLSKIESGVVQLRTGTIFLDELIKDVATVYAEEANARGLKLRIHTSSGRAVVKTDGLLLRQSLMNLVHNALRYTKHGGVLIACRRRGDDWQLEVWDTGVGVAIEDQDKIFSPFFRNEYAWKIDSAGHGLGLAVVSRCCNLMGSQYGLTSKLGRGSRFWLRVPAITSQMQSIRIINVTGNTAFSGMGESLSGTCLIVDDDPQVSSAWELLLNTWGLQARCASSATEAFAWIDSGLQPQAILCDQRLRAGESGFDVLRALLERCPDAHGAMISGEFNSPELIEAEQEGYLVLHKPLEPETLYTLLTRWLPIKNQ